MGDQLSFLPERQRTHGDFDRVSECAQRLKEFWRAHPSWSRMTPSQKEGIEMIEHKLCRILCGDPNFRDHWQDIAGYAMRVWKRSIARRLRPAPAHQGRGGGVTRRYGYLIMILPAQTIREIKPVSPLSFRDRQVFLDADSAGDLTASQWAACPTSGWVQHLASRVAEREHFSPLSETRARLLRSPVGSVGV
jgi:hypothetical protein